MKLIHKALEYETEIWCLFGTYFLAFSFHVTKSSYMHVKLIPLPE